ncbi:acyl-CoA dehydrogenase [Nocardioides sp. QY071]|uniref:acyl-CoA dehydrogenase n=1 Tax=Nocardioides sp. QY071 TaxID=3044187 RepID=UPI00249B4C02|nr:acyl-CoA dehydrogenase [Nocardioides sp. QY071]WGY01664.1 acyl-CoA dehydrogenase [Nocardioides sp. QY071]
MTSDLTAALADFFAATWPADTPIAESGPLAQTRWSPFAALGLHLVGVPEESGGSGGTVDDLVALAVLAGRHAADVPLVESTTAAWALAEAGFPVDASVSSSMPVAPASLVIHDDGTVTGQLTDVPWGGSVDQVVAVTDDGRTVALAPRDAVVALGVDLAGQPRDTLTFERIAPLATGTGLSPDRMRRRTAMLRIAMTAGALQACSELTRRYVSERVQFGRPIGAFQAVQAHVVQLEQMAVMTTAVAERLAMQVDPHDLDLAAAQVVTSENALVAARAAHQAHGAIGMTREYRLQGYTRRLHTWAGDLGEELELSRRLGVTASSAASFAHLVLDDNRPELRP